MIAVEWRSRVLHASQCWKWQSVIGNCPTKFWSIYSSWFYIENLHEYQNDLAYCCEEQLVYRFLSDTVPIIILERNSTCWDHLIAFQSHQEKCPYKIIQCPSTNCSVKLARNLIEDHLANACLWKIIACQFCNDNHPKSQEHVRS